MTDTSDDTKAFARILSASLARLFISEARLPVPGKVLEERTYALRKELSGNRNALHSLATTSLSACGEVEACGLAACPFCRGFGDAWLSSECQRFAQANADTYLVLGYPKANYQNKKEFRFPLSEYHERFKNFVLKAGFDDRPWIGRHHATITFLEADRRSTGLSASFVALTKAASDENLEDRLKRASETDAAYSVSVLRKSADRRGDASWIEAQHRGCCATWAGDSLPAILEANEVSFNAFECWRLKKAGRRAEAKLALELGLTTYRDLLLPDAAAEVECLPDSPRYSVTETAE